MKRFFMMLAFMLVINSQMSAQVVGDNIPSIQEIDLVITKINQEMSILKSEMNTYKLRIKIDKSDADAQAMLQHHKVLLKNMKKELGEVKDTKKELKKYIKCIAECEKQKTKYFGKDAYFKTLQKKY